MTARTRRRRLRRRSPKPVSSLMKFSASVQIFAQVRADLSDKRKAEAEPAPVAKKAKVEESNGEAPASSTVFVGKLSWNVDNDWLKSEFQHIGEIVSCRVQWDHDQNRSKGFGFVEFSSPDLAQKAVTEMANKEIDGREINIDIAAGRSDKPKNNDRRAAAFGDKKSDPADTLFVGNLPFSASEDQLYELFAEYGDVQSVRLPTDRESGAPKGFGYVTMGDVSQATKALESMSGQAQIEGRSVSFFLLLSLLGRWLTWPRSLRLDYSGPKPPREVRTSIVILTASFIFPSSIFSNHCSVSQPLFARLLVICSLPFSPSSLSVVFLAFSCSLPALGRELQAQHHHLLPLHYDLLVPYLWNAVWYPYYRKPSKS